MQSRAELLQNEYKKVIENHPGTIGVPVSSKYDDTDFLSQMFTKKNLKQSGHIEPLGLNKQDSSEVLHKSQSLKMMDNVQQSNTGTGREANNQNITINTSNIIGINNGGGPTL